MINSVNIKLVVKKPDNSVDTFNFLSDSIDREEGFLEFYDGDTLIIGVPVSNVVYFSSIPEEGEVSDDS